MRVSDSRTQSPPLSLHTTPYTPMPCSNHHLHPAHSPLPYASAGSILGTPLQPLLAEVAAACGSVIVCRASPSQKAAIVRMMMDYELRAAEAAGGGGALGRFTRRYKRRMENKMLAIGDGMSRALQVA